MRSETITIANLSCGGCVNTITKRLTSIHGVETVEVDLETNNVLVTHSDTVIRDQLTEMLFAIGYPEATEKNGLLLKLKSMTSCLTGKLSK